MGSTLEERQSHTDVEGLPQPVVWGRFGCEIGPPAARPLRLDDLSVSEEQRIMLLRSRLFASVSVAYDSSTLVQHPAILRRFIRNHVAGRNPLAAVCDAQITVQFALGRDEPEPERLVKAFAEGVARMIGASSDAVCEARVLTFDTTDIDHELLPEFRTEE